MRKTSMTGSKGRRIPSEERKENELRSIVMHGDVPVIEIEQSAIKDSAHYWEAGRLRRSHVTSAKQDPTIFNILIQVRIQVSLFQTHTPPCLYIRTQYM